MFTYRVVTAQKTVYVPNVIEVDLGNPPLLQFHREGGNIVTFPLANVVSYEKIVVGRAQ